MRARRNTAEVVMRVGSWGLVIAILLGGCIGRGLGGGGTGGTSSAFGVFTGSLTFNPPLTNASGASVDAVGSGDTVPGTVSANGDYVIYPVVAGTYSVTASCPGYAAASVVGVVSTAGTDFQVPALTLIGLPDAGDPSHSSDGG